MITEITKFTNEKVIPIMFENVTLDGQTTIRVTEEQVSAVVMAIRVMEETAEILEAK